MASINQISPDQFSIQDYTFQDYTVVPNFGITSLFQAEEDVVEYFIYDNNKNLLLENYQFPNYSFTEDPSITNLGGYSTINLDPERDLISNGYDVGQYNTVYNFFEPQLGSNFSSSFYIKEISSDRTELRLSSNAISSDTILALFPSFKQKLEGESYFNEFYLNFGKNQIVIGVNTQLDGSDVLIKLYEPLPTTFVLKDTCWVVLKIADPVAYNINLISEITPLVEIPFLKGPNTNIQIKEEINNSTDLKSYAELISSNLTSSYQQVSNLLNSKGIEISVDYTDYSNFVFFSSAEQRLLNFYEKVSLIEGYQNSLATGSFNITGSTSASFYASESQNLVQTQINNIIKNFDGYEHYLYFESGAYAWPKQNTEPPYVLYSTGSTQVLDWIGNSNENAGNTSPSSIYPYGKYGGLALSASRFDNDNQNSLTKTIPEYISNDSQNAPYELFVEMIGQHFDNIWIYLKDITNKYDADNRLNYGISKDLVAQAIRDFGLKLYQNQFASDDLYSAFLGITPSGSLLPSTGSELITSYVTASSDVIPLDDVNKSIYKRLYHNLPYLLNKKGTIQGIKALIASYGIPNTILRVSEFGGKDRDNSNDWDYWYNKFNYAFETSGSKFVSSSFAVNSTWGAANDVPNAVEFRFKAENVPPTNYSQSLWTLNGGAELTLEYTGSGLTTSSLYSGSVVDTYYQYGTLHFKPTPTTSASVYLPFFDGGWWSVLVNKSSNTYELISKNKIYQGDDASLIGFQSSGSVTVSTTNWTNSTVSTFASGSQESFSGSLQEVRYYKEALTQATFDDYVMNPLSSEGNSLNSSPLELIFRAPLGAELEQTSDIQQSSIHPKITGSWTVTQSFASDSNFNYSSTPYFIPNTEYIFLDQPAAGIKNRISDKVRIGTQITPTGSVLSQYRSIEQQLPLSQSYTPDINLLEVAFSPQNEINDDIIEQIGYFNVGNYIGDPRYISSSRTDYEDLSKLAIEYFQKYTHNYDVYDYVRLIKYFDNSLFKMIKDFVPAKTSLQSGVVIKQHLLERNRYPQPQVEWEQNDYSGSISVGSFSGGPGGSVNTLNTPAGWLRVQDNDPLSNLVIDTTPKTVFTSSVYSFIDTLNDTFFETNGQTVGTGLGLPDTSGRLTNITDYDYTGDIQFSLFNYPPALGSQVDIKVDIVEEGKGIVVTDTQTVPTGTTFYFRFNQFTFKARTTYFVQLSTTSGSTRVRRFQLTFENWGQPQNWNGQVYIDDNVDTIAGIFKKFDTSEAQFYNGEYSGSTLIATTQSLNPECRVWLDAIPSGYYYTASVFSPSVSEDITYSRFIDPVNTPLLDGQIFFLQDGATSLTSAIRIAKVDANGNNLEENLAELTSLSTVSELGSLTYNSNGIPTDLGTDFLVEVNNSQVAPTSTFDQTLDVGFGVGDSDSDTNFFVFERGGGTGKGVPETSFIHPVLTGSGDDGKVMYAAPFSQFYFPQGSGSVRPGIVLTNGNTTDYPDERAGWYPRSGSIVYHYSNAYRSYIGNLEINDDANFQIANGSTNDVTFRLAIYAKDPGLYPGKGYYRAISLTEERTLNAGGQYIGGFTWNKTNLLPASQLPSNFTTYEDTPYYLGVITSSYNPTGKYATLDFQRMGNIQFGEAATLVDAIETIPEFSNPGTFQNSDCDVLAGNATNDRDSVFWMDVDYSSNAAIAVNSEAIISGGATKAEVQDSNYTLTRHINPRYNGSRSTSEQLNVWTSGSTNTFGKLAVADSDKTYFAYFDFINGLSPELKNKSIAHIQFLVSESGEQIPPDSDKLFITQNTFKTGERVIINLNDPLRFEVPMNELNGLKTIYRGGQRVDSILYTDSGSSYVSTINFDTGSFSVIDYEFGTLNNLGPFTPSSGINQYDRWNIDTKANAQWNNSTDIYTFASDTNSPVKFKVSSEFLFSNAGGTITLYIVKNWTSGTPSPSQILAQQSFGGGGSSGTATFNLETSFLNFDSGDTVQVVYNSTFTGVTYILNRLGNDTFQAVNQINPNGSIDATFWTTGSAPDTWLTASLDLSAAYGSKQLDVIPYDGTTNNPEFDPIIQNFTVRVGDEIRFQGAEAYARMITKVIEPSVSLDGKLYLELDNLTPVGANADHFLIRRYVDDASYIILDTTKPIGSTSPGTLVPEFTTDTLQNNLPNASQDIIKSIT